MKLSWGMAISFVERNWLFGFSHIRGEGQQQRVINVPKSAVVGIFAKHGISRVFHFFFTKITCNVIGYIFVQMFQWVSQICLCSVIILAVFLWELLDRSLLWSPSLKHVGRTRGQKACPITQTYWWSGKGVWDHNGSIFASEFQFPKRAPAYSSYSTKKNHSSFLNVSCNTVLGCVDQVAVFLDDCWYYVVG